MCFTWSNKAKDHQLAALEQLARGFGPILAPWIPLPGVLVLDLHLPGRPQGRLASADLLLPNATNEIFGPQGALFDRLSRAKGCA
jgi:hypothetical protein